MAKKIVLGLSGGVDSAVSALLLKESGWDVTCVFMRNWDASANYDISGNPTIDDEICPQEQDFLDAQKVADQLGLKLIKVNFTQIYWDKVFNYFLSEYAKGRTPNPDVLCNNEIKFKAFIQWAQENLETDYIAMGHYATIKEVNGVCQLARSKDALKDQTYFLSNLSLQQIQKVVFPIGNLLKEEVRALAIKNNLAVATKKDSTGICFIGERNFSLFLANYLQPVVGDIRSLDGTFLKKHQGLINYTIGQRKALGLGGSRDSTKPWYVVKKDLSTNTLYVEREGHPYLISNNAILEQVVLRMQPTQKLTCKFRHRGAYVNCSLKVLEDNKIHIFYDDSKAVTPGQFCSIYQDDICLGSGIIDLVFYNDEARA
ncbi:MAG: tRNA 2-thiouridine(34) synthase MnmA [Acholeplasmatales bacterium]|jgi:tRNA-specific 2-thiouridylase|nr:tRNA 2-thiouridine(34) synthase MnmA [Acholeplasmatales bacterium]